MRTLVADVVRLRARVRRLIAATPADALDALLSELDLGRLVRLMGTDTRPFADVVRGRADTLHPRTLARLIHALQQRRHSPAHRTIVRDAFLGAQGQRLRDLCLELNWLGDHHDLEHVVFEGLDPIMRADVLGHIAEQSRHVTIPELRILCDIDDTVLAALHERRWPRGTVYPGIVEFVRALDRGAADTPGRPGDLTFVTARPVGPGGIVERYTRDGLAALGLPPHTVLSGSIWNLFTLGSIAVRKLQNFERERQLFPECRAVFIGDSGQADAFVGWAMRERDSEYLAAVYIHNVTDMDDELRATWAKRGVTVVDTYAGAAIHAAALGLITAADADAVEIAVRRGILDQPERVQSALTAILDRDLDRVTEDVRRGVR